MKHWLSFFRTLLLATVGLAASLVCATTVTISSSGNWTAPAGVTSVTVEAWGGGGAGGGATTNPGKGGGGAGGQYARKVLTVTPGSVYAVVVGTGGNGSTGNGASGGDSSFAATSVVAKGGAGGTGATNGVAGTGSSASGVGDVVYAGGSGSSGSTTGTGGAGGGGAGSTGAGGSASGLTGGVGSTIGGGNGGDGLSSRATGNTGNDSGGGGGGGYATSNTDRSGGDGGNGKVVITYAQAPSVTTNAATSITAGGATLNGAVTSNGGSTTVIFEYGLTTSYGSTITATQSPAALDASALAVSAAITGLSQNTTYHFRVKGTNSAGTTSGSDRTFVTTGPPSVTSINRASFDPTKKGATVSWTVVFSASVTGVDATDFSLAQSGGATGAAITSVTGSGTTWTVTAGTGTGTTGTLGLNLVDDDTIGSGGVVLGGTGAGNGNFTGQAYTLIASVCSGASDILFCDDFERSNPGTLGNGWTVTPANASNCAGASGNAGCSGIDSDIPPFNTYSNPRPNSTRAMFTRWSIVSVDSPVIDLSVTTGAQLSFWMRRGRDTFSECPEGAGENYLVQYYSSNNTWKTLAQYPSSPSAALCDGKIFTPTIELPVDALHANFKMRFYQPSGSGSSGTNGGAAGVVGYDYWHMDDVVIRKVTAPVYVGAFCDNFEAGLSRWSISAEGYASGNIGDASIGSLAYQSSSHELDMRWGYVTAATFKTDLTGVSGNITFWLRSGTSSALDPVTNENLVVEYMNSSGAWTTLNTYLGSVAAGTSYSASYAIPTDAKHAGFRLRFRQVAGSGYDKSYWHIDDVCVGNAVSSSDLALTKTGDSTLIPGTNTTYTLKATNNGPDPLSGAIQVVDTLPNGLTFLSGTGTGWLCTANAQTVTCTWSGTLANGVKAPDLAILASVGASVTGSITNTAVLTGTGNDPVTTNNTASFTSGNFIPYFIFTNGACVDGIAIGQPGQTCGALTWTAMVAGVAKSGIYITAVNASGVPTKLSSSAATTVSTQFGLTCHDPIAHAGVQATFSAVAAALPLCTGSGAEPTSWSAATSLTFASGAPGIATSYAFAYADVGQVELYMRNSVATTQLGTSGSFVVAPSGFVLSAIKCTAYAASSCATSAIASPGNNPAAASMAGTRFIQAGQPFAVTVTAVNAAGSATPNFGQEKIREGVQLGANLVLPSGGNAVDLNNPSAFGNFVSGVATGTTFNWPEVGIITLTPSVADGDYLGAGDVVGTTSGNIGRFYPDHFTTVVTQGCSTFTYSGQPMTVAVTAFNGQSTPNPTLNYGLTTNSVTLSDVGTATYFTNNTVASSSFSVSTGIASASPTYTFANRSTAPTAITVRAVDLDSVSSSGYETSAISTIVSGRLNLLNAYGSEQLALPLLTRVEYYDTATSAGWRQSSGSYADSCTNLTAANFGFTTTASGCATAVSSCLTALSVSATGVGPYQSPWTVVLSKPTASGSTCITASLDGTAVGKQCTATGLPGATATSASAAWLKYTWASGAVSNPTARANFGLYKSPLIYRRENY